MGQAITPYECNQMVGFCSMMLTTKWPMMTDQSPSVWNLAESSGAFFEHTPMTAEWPQVSGHGEGRYVLE